MEGENSGRGLRGSDIHRKSQAMDWEETSTVVDRGDGTTLGLLAILLGETCRPMALLDHDASILELNDAMAGFLSVPKQEARGHILFDVLSARGVGGPVEQALSSDNEYAAGDRIPFSTMLETESATHMRQMMHGSMRKLEEGLWLLTLERTIDELMLLRRRAEAVSQIAHNMRSSLTSVRGFTELLLTRDFTPDEVQEFLGHVHREGIVLQTMVDALATYVYYQSGRALNWPITTWKVEKLVDRAVKEVKASLGETAVEVLLEDSETELLGNLEHMAFGLSRVIENAILFGQSPTTPPPRIRGARRERVYEILVEDSGPGMSAKTARRAFEPFYSGTSASKQSRPRMGLGLTVARYTVEVHGGTIRLDTAPGEGTQVRIALPLVPSDS